MPKDVFLQNMFTNQTESEFLKGLILQLVQHLKAGNEHLFTLLKKITSNRQCVIEIDHVKLLLESKYNTSYQLEITEAAPEISVTFRTQGDCIRDILDGTYTLDYAIMKGYIEVFGSIEDLINIHALFIGILSEGPVMPQLRALWTDFNSHWVTHNHKPGLKTLESQNLSNYNIYENIDPVVLGVKVNG